MRPLKGRGVHVFQWLIGTFLQLNEGLIGISDKYVFSTTRHYSRRFSFQAYCQGQILVVSIRIVRSFFKYDLVNLVHFIEDILYHSMPKNVLSPKRPFNTLSYKT